MNKILEALKSREWQNYARPYYYGKYCPDCNAEKVQGHAPDCPYAAAIREVKEAIAHK